MAGADGIENVTHREWLVVFDRVVNEVKAELDRQGRQDEFVGAKASIASSLSLSFTQRQAVIRLSIRQYDSSLRKNWSGT